MKIFLMIFVLFFFSVSNAYDSVENISSKLILELINNSNRSMSGKSSCKFNIKQRGGVTLGEWLARNLSFFENGKLNSISSSCTEGSKGKTKCQVDFRADSKSESPWSCGFRFDVDSKTFKLDYKTLECIGSC